MAALISSGITARPALNKTPSCTCAHTHTQTQTLNPLPSNEMGSACPASSSQQSCTLCTQSGSTPLSLHPDSLQEHSALPQHALLVLELMLHLHAVPQSGTLGLCAPAQCRSGSTSFIWLHPGGVRAPPGRAPGADFAARSKLSVPLSVPGVYSNLGLVP